MIGKGSFLVGAHTPLIYPGEKDRVNAQLARALVGTTQKRAVVREIIIVLRPVTLKHVGTNGSRINNAGVSTLK